jgi:hypothetical protein
MAKDDQPSAGTLADTVSVQPAQISARQALAAWLDQFIRNTAYARDTEAWNRISSGVGIIKAIDKVDAIQKGQ